MWFKLIIRSKPRLRYTLYNTQCNREKQHMQQHRWLKHDFSLRRRASTEKTNSRKKYSISTATNTAPTTRTEDLQQQQPFARGCIDTARELAALDLALPQVPPIHLYTRTPIHALAVLSGRSISPVGSCIGFASLRIDSLALFLFLSYF